MKLDVVACLLFCVTGIAVLATRSCDPTGDAIGAASTTTDEPEIVTGGTETIELTAPRTPRTWFPNLDELLADRAINPDARALSDSDAELVRAEIDRASAELSAIDAQYTEAQAAIARDQVERGLAEPYVEGVSDAALRVEDAGVVIAQLDDGAGPWLVRISHEELPQAAAWRHEADTIRDRVRVVLGRRLREAAAGVAAR